MEFCTGAHINDVENLKKQGVDVYDVSNKIGQMYSKMIFDDGYVHCDPHPGLTKNSWILLIDSDGWSSCRKCSGPEESLRRDRNSPAGPRSLHAAL